MQLFPNSHGVFPPHLLMFETDFLYHDKKTPSFTREKSPVVELTCSIFPKLCQLILYFVICIWHQSKHNHTHCMAPAQWWYTEPVCKQHKVKSW